MRAVRATAQRAAPAASEGTALSRRREKKTTIFMLMNKGVNARSTPVSVNRQTEGGGGAGARWHPSARLYVLLLQYTCVWSGDNPLFVFNV